MDLIESEKSHCYNFQCQQGKRQLGKKGRIQMLKLEQIKKSYDGVEILKEMNLEIEDGEIVSILGPSGCGKTTLLNLILGITEADSGKIWFNGEDITNLAMEKRGAPPVPNRLAKAVMMVMTGSVRPIPVSASVDVWGMWPM